MRAGVAAKEQQEFRDYAVADAIKSLLPVVDSLERALQVKSDAAEFRTGVELIYKQLQAALAKLSVSPLCRRAKLFDPRFHEAIEMVETTEAPDHQVLEELQRGYKFKDRLLRPAMVKVAKNPGESAWFEFLLSSPLFILINFVTTGKAPILATNAKRDYYEVLGVTRTVSEVRS